MCDDDYSFVCMCCQGMGGNCLVSYIWFSTACETWFRVLFLFYFCVLLVVSCLGLFSRVLLVLAKVRLHACVGYLYEALTNIVLLGRTLLNMKAAALEKKREKSVKKVAAQPQFFMPLNLNSSKAGTAAFTWGELRAANVTTVQLPVMSTMAFNYC